MNRRQIEVFRAVMITGSVTPFFVAQPLKRHTVHSEFDVYGLQKLPRVDIDYTTLGSDGVPRERQRIFEQY